MSYYDRGAGLEGLGVLATLFVGIGTLVVLGALVWAIWAHVDWLDAAWLDEARVAIRTLLGE